MVTKQTVAGKAQGRGSTVVGIVHHLGRMHAGGRCGTGQATGGGRIQPATSCRLGVHIPPGTCWAALQAIHLGLDMRGTGGGGHVERPSFVGVDSRHAGVHGLHALEVSGAGWVHLGEQGRRVSMAGVGGGGSELVEAAAWNTHTAG